MCATRGDPVGHTHNLAEHTLIWVFCSTVHVTLPDTIHLGMFRTPALFSFSYVIPSWRILSKSTRHVSLKKTNFLVLYSKAGQACMPRPIGGNPVATGAGKMRTRDMSPGCGTVVFNMWVKGSKFKCSSDLCLLIRCCRNSGINSMKLHGHLWKLREKLGQRRVHYILYGLCDDDTFSVPLDDTRCHAPNTFGTVNMEHTIDSRLSWSKWWVWPT